MRKALLGFALSLVLGNEIVVAADYDKGLKAYESGDYATALSEWTPLANGGDAKTQFSLGQMMRMSRRSFETRETGIEWITKAAEQGFIDAQYQLGEYHFVHGPSEKSAFWFIKSAEQGHIMGQQWAGSFYADGFDGILKNSKTAVKWYTLAGEQGDAASQQYLGEAYSLGIGVLKDDKKAVKWFLKAAKQGASRSQFNLGASYYNGTGVFKNNVLSYMWFSLADFNEDYNAGAKRDFVAKSMDSSQIAKAQEMSSRCLASDYTDC